MGSRATRAALVAAVGIMCGIGPSAAAAAEAVSPQLEGMSFRREVVSFRREVVPVLTQAGCNAGTCHGTPSGKNGFRLSLRGYDPHLDYHTIVREMGGRRIDRLDPARSLLLLKATAQVPHEGGRRIEPQSRAYQLLHDWIAQGAADDRAAPPTALQIEPVTATVDAPAQAVDFRVRAVFADGQTIEVTHLVRWSLSDELAARVDPPGRLVRRQAGEVVATAEYMGVMAAATVLFRDPRPDYRWPELPAHNFIDEQAYAKWRQLQLTPAGQCSDFTFVRRAFLDAVGRLPTPEEIRRFVADPRPDKRERLIDQLLELPEFADWWGMKWADRLGVNQRFVGKIGAVKYHQWIRAQMAANVPEDVFVREILTGAGGNYSSPPAGFYRRLRNAELRVEEITQLFLGVRLQCAKCHNHPGERWTQDDYYSLAALFQRVQYRDGPFFVQIYDKEETVVARRDGEVRHPRTGQVMPPRLLGEGGPVAVEDKDPRAVFAEWLTQPSNPYFARMAVNRVWFHLFGRGLVEPVDDFRSSNPPSLPGVLDALAEDFVRHGYDRKHLIRRIMTSRLYQLDNGTGDDDVRYRYFAAYRPRRLGAEALLDAICDATGVPEKFPGFPLGTRAVQLPDGELAPPFLRTFGRPPRASACECEREDDVSFHMALMLQGGEFLQGKLSHPDGRLSRLLQQPLPDAAILEELFLCTLGRGPQEAERLRLLEHVRRHPPPQRRQAWEDVFHALLTHPEFLFQH